MYIYSRDRRGFFPGGSCFFVSTFTISEKSNIHVSKKAGCLLTIGLKSPAFAVYSFNLLIDQLLQLIHKGTDIFKLSVYRRKAYIRYRIQILQMFHNDLSDLGTADLMVF